MYCSGFQGEYSESETFLRRALAIDEKVLGPELPTVAEVLNSLGLLLESKGDYSAPEPLFRRALAIDEKVLGPEHLCTAKMLNNLPEVLEQRADYAGAEPLFRRALTIYEKVPGILNDHFKSGQRLSLQNGPTGLAVRD